MEGFLYTCSRVSHMQLCPLHVCWCVCPCTLFYGNVCALMMSLCLGPCIRLSLCICPGPLYFEVWGRRNFNSPPFNQSELARKGGRGGMRRQPLFSLTFFILEGERQPSPRDSLIGFLPGCPRSNSNATQRRGERKGWRRGNRAEGPLLFTPPWHGRSQETDGREGKI